MKLKRRFVLALAIFVAALMLLVPLSQINLSGLESSDNYADDDIVLSDGSTGVSSDTDLKTYLEAGTSVKLSDNITLNLNSPINVSAENVVLDLNGNTLTISKIDSNISNRIIVQDEASLTIRNGTISYPAADTSELNKSPLKVGTGGDATVTKAAYLTLDDVNIVSGGYGVGVFSKGNLTVNGGSITAVKSAISTNGSAPNNGSNSCDAVIKLNGGQYISTTTAAIYFAGGKELTVNKDLISNAIVVGKTGFDIRSGTVSICDTDIHIICPTEKKTDNSGPTGWGMGVAVFDNGAYGKNFISENVYGVTEINVTVADTVSISNATYDWYLAGFSNYGNLRDSDGSFKAPVNRNADHNILISYMGEEVASCGAGAPITADGANLNAESAGLAMPIEIINGNAFIFANGNDITISAGTKYHSKITYNSNKTFIGDLDLSAFTIIGGSKTGEISTSKITMDGGKVGGLSIGSTGTGKITGTASLEVTGGTVSGLYLGRGLDTANVTLDVGNTRTVYAQDVAHDSASEFKYTVGNGKTWKLISGTLKLDENASIKNNGTLLIECGTLSGTSLSGRNSDGTNNNGGEITGLIKLLTGSTIESLNIDGKVQINGVGKDGDITTIKNNNFNGVSGPAIEYDHIDSGTVNVLENYIKIAGTTNAAIFITGVADGTNNSFYVNIEDNTFVSSNGRAISLGDKYPVAIGGNRFNIVKNNFNAVAEYGGIVLIRNLYYNSELIVNENTFLKDCVQVSLAGSDNILKESDKISYLDGLKIDESVTSISIAEGSQAAVKSEWELPTGVTLTVYGRNSIETTNYGGQSPGVTIETGATLTIKGNLEIDNSDSGEKVDFLAKITNDGTMKYVSDTKLSGGLVIDGYGGNVIVENMEFETKGLYIENAKDVTIAGCTFTNISESPLDATKDTNNEFSNAISIIRCTGDIIIGEMEDGKGNVMAGRITDSSGSPGHVRGIYIRYCGGEETTLTIQNNNISNTDYNAIQAYESSFKTIAISNNTISEWDADNDSATDGKNDGYAGGRAIRVKVDSTCVSVTISNNTFTKAYTYDAFNSSIGSGEMGYDNGNILYVTGSETPTLIVKDNVLKLTGISVYYMGNYENGNPLFIIGENYKTVIFDAGNGYFNSDSSAKIMASLVKSGEKVTEPTQNPSRSGLYGAYLFLAWMNGTVSYNFDTSVAENLTLTTSWRYISESAVPTPSTTDEPKTETKETTDTKTTEDGSQITTNTKTEETKDADGNVISSKEEVTTETTKADGTKIVQNNVTEVKDGKETSTTTLEINDKDDEVKTSAEIISDSSGTKVESKTEIDASENEVTEETVTKALEQIEELKSTIKQKSADVVPVVEINTSSEVNLTSEALGSLAESGAEVKIKTDTGDIQLSKEVLSKLASESENDKVTLSIEKVDNNNLNKEQKEIVKDSLVLDLTAKTENKNISDLGGKITVSVPYDLKDGEDPNKISVWYITDGGEVTKMETTYDAKTGMISFTTNHLSYYFVAQDVTVPTPSSEEEESNDNTMYYIIAAIVVIIVIAAIAFFVMKKKE